MKIDEVYDSLKSQPKKWLVTGCAGFIGSNLLEELLSINQQVIGVDNFVTGHKSNLEEVKFSVSENQWNQFQFIEGDIRKIEICKDAVNDVDFVLHQAALGSVPRSLEDPLTTNAINIAGFLNILHASKEANVESFTFAASSSTYGDHKALPKVENIIGKPLSPYAVTKLVNELYAENYRDAYNFSSIGLRYFNVFGKRQDPNSAYAAVIPKWISAMITGSDLFINGDGETSRDFCYIKNVVQANILAATCCQSENHGIYNIAIGERTTLNQLYQELSSSLRENNIDITNTPIYRDFRKGDVRHSLASIEKARTSLNYSPQFTLRDGIKDVMPWYINFFKKSLTKNL